MRTIIAIGGDEIGGLLRDGTNRTVKMAAIHREILARTGKKRPRVLYIPTAKDDSQEFIAGFTKYYYGLGAGKVDVLRLIKAKPSKKTETEALIAGADAVYVNGGSTFRMLRIWRRTGVDEMLKAAYESGKVLAGHSAGAICWFRYGCSDSFYKSRPFRITGLGLVDGVMCPHYDTEPVRQMALKEIMKRTPGVAFALDEYSAIEMDGRKVRVLTGRPKAKARVAYWDHGFRLRCIPQRKSFVEIDALMLRK